MEDAIGSRLFEACGGGVHGLSRGGKGAGGQHLDSLGLSNFGTGVDHLLSGFKEFSGELSKMENFTFDEWVPQSSYGSVDKLLIRLSMFEDSLAKGMEWRLSAVARSGLQRDHEDGMSLPHGEEGSGVSVIQYEPHVLGLAPVVVSVIYGRQDAKSSIRPVLYERWAWVSESQGMVDDLLVGAAYYNQGRQ